MRMRSGVSGRSGVYLRDLGSERVKGFKIADADQKEIRFTLPLKATKTSDRYIYGSSF